MQIDFKVKNQTLECISDYRAAEGSQNYIKCRFEFSDDWNGLTKAAIIMCRNAVKPLIIYTDENDCFSIPGALSGICAMSLVGTDGNITITTNIVTLTLEQTLSAEGVEGIDDPKNDFSELIKKIDGIKTELEKSFSEKISQKADKSDLETEDGSITAAKLADRAVTGEKIAIHTITADNLDSDIAAWVESKLSKSEASEAFALKSETDSKISAAIRAYDTEAMALLGGDEE